MSRVLGAAARFRSGLLHRRERRRSAGPGEDRVGRVALVGAGPGDPSLLTLGALRWLQEADVVLYDRLVSDEILDLVPARCERVPVGKGPRQPSTAQESIHELMVRGARAGKTVVRLKGGDPFVFGRGAEEVAALARAGLQAEVVPGVSSALAGPASAGIPVTLRNVSSSFAVVTGHRSADAPSEPDWAALARLDCLVILMGVGRAGAIAERLRGAGLASDTPVAVVEDATLLSQRVTRATLGELAAVVEREGLRAPAVIVVGETARAEHAAVGQPNRKSADELPRDRLATGAHP